LSDTIPCEIELHLNTVSMINIKS